MLGCNFLRILYRELGRIHKYRVDHKGAASHHEKHFSDNGTNVYCCVLWSTRGLPAVCRGRNVRDTMIVVLGGNHVPRPERSAGWVSGMLSNVCLCWDSVSTPFMKTVNPNDKSPIEYSSLSDPK